MAWPWLVQDRQALGAPALWPTGSFCSSRAPGPGSRSDRPLSAMRKNVCEKKDPEHSASVVLRAIRAENETLQEEMRCRHQEASAAGSSQCPGLDQAASAEVSNGGFSLPSHS